MRIALTLLALAAAALAQSGTITGSVTDPEGAGVPNVIVRARNTATRKLYSATSAARGVYSLGQLPVGSYDLTIPAMGASFAPLETKGVALGASQTLHLDLRLAWGGSLGTPGDDPFLFNRGKPAPAGQPAPRTSDGRPDLSGVWWAKRMAQMGPPELLPWAEKVFKERRAGGGPLSPASLCLPGDPLLSFPLFYKIVQTPSTIVMLWEGQPPGFRQVFLDQTDHSKALGPSWLGHSIAHWEQDTLVVDTAAFNDRSWIWLWPHTTSLHVIEHWRRPELARLEKEFTIEDPETYAKPWKSFNTWDLDLNEEIHEYVCNENEVDAPHLTGKR